MEDSSSYSWGNISSQDDADKQLWESSDEGLRDDLEDVLQIHWHSVQSACVRKQFHKSGFI